MKVRLIAYMQFNPEYLRQHNLPVRNGEWMASALMHSTRTREGLLEILRETCEEEVVDRITKSVQWGHFTVAGMLDFIFEIEGVSRVLSHQLVRHRMAWFLQQTQRSTDPTHLVPILPPTVTEAGMENDYSQHWDKTKSLYHTLVEKGVPIEDARYILPNATQTRLVMKIDGSNLIHFLKLRIDPHAQWEIRELAKQIHSLIKKTCPNLFSEELKEYWW